METQAELKLEVGTQEPERVKLNPKKVKIVNVSIEVVQKQKKVSFEVKHPDREITIKISSIVRIVEKQLKSTGTWFSLDKEGKLQKGTALADFLKYLGAKNLEDTIGKEVQTELDGNFLCFKAY